MAKTKKKLTKEEKLAKDRLRKKNKYAEIKNDPEQYRIQKEKERRRYLLRKEKNKIISIQDMSERAKREQRRRWRKNSRKYLKKLEEQKKIQNILLNDSPPMSEVDVAEPPPVLDPLEVGNNSQSKTEVQENSAQDRKNASRIRKLRYKSAKVIGKLKEDINKLKREKDVLRKKIQRIKFQKEKEMKSKEDTIEKNDNQLLKDVKADKVEEVKKKLLFNESLTRGVCEHYKNLRKKEKRPFSEEILKDKAKFKKHKVLAKVPFVLRNKITETEHKNKTDEMKQQIQRFFEDDINSQMAPGKNDIAKQGTSHIQKRYLSDNLKNLYAKYCKEFSYISFSTFCKYRPFWVDFPDGKRDTCQCKLHANVELLAKSLKNAHIITEGSATEILNSVCCDDRNQQCLERSCNDCKNKILVYKEFDDSVNIKYQEWITEKQAYKLKDGTEKYKNVTTKKNKEDRPRNIMKKLDDIMESFLKHTRNIVVQQNTIKNHKKNLTENEVVCHVDFSENYCLKFHEEIQSFHFGGSRGQVSLHTGVLYYKNSKEETGPPLTKSFCTMSQCLNHDASAVWAHITPVLDLAQQLIPSLTTIHFVSDSPSSQYRNRFIFYMLTKLKEQVPTLQEITWNYMEAGHGKGAPDGIGAVVKNAADSHVKYGGDVGSFEEFVRIVEQRVDNVDLIVVAEEQITRKKFPPNVPGFKGTTKVHQVVWSASLPYSVAFRSLSCFFCRNSYMPCEHNKHLGVLTVGFDQTSTAQIESTSLFDPPVDSDFRIYSENESLKIDSPTIFNNVGNMLLNEYDGTFEEEIQTQNIKKPSQVKILTNIPYSYQRFAVHNNSIGFASTEQIEYEKFLTLANNDIDMTDFDRELEPSILKNAYDDSNKENTFNITEEEQIENEKFTTSSNNVIELTSFGTEPLTPVSKKS